MTSKSLGPCIALALLALMTTACPGEPDPGTTTDDDASSSSSTTSTSFPDECGTGGGVSDYCCQFNSNYCNTDTETDTSPSDTDSTDSTVPETDTDPLPPDTDGTLAGCGQYDEDGYVLINADGTAVRRSWGRSDFVFEAEGARLGELPPAEHFDACLADPDDLARFDCMRAELDSMLGVCDGGWSYDVE